MSDAESRARELLRVAEAHKAHGEVAASYADAILNDRLPRHHAPAAPILQPVVDFRPWDVRLLAQHRPDLVSIEPNMAAILAELRALTPWYGEQSVQSIPGVTAWWNGQENHR